MILAYVKFLPLVFNGLMDINKIIVKRLMDINKIIVKKKNMLIVLDGIQRYSFVL